MAEIASWTKILGELEENLTELDLIFIKSGELLLSRKSPGFAEIGS